MLLKEILDVKGRDVLKIAPTASVAEVVQKLVAHNCGALVVCDGDKMVGIISERDVLRAISGVSQPLDQITVQERMTTQVVTGSPKDNVNDVMGLMTKNRIRHLPVLEDGVLAGMISIGDVVKSQHQKLTLENQMLMNYIQS